MPAASHEYKPQADLRGAIDLGWLATVWFAHDKGITYNIGDQAIGDEAQQFLAVVNRTLPDKLELYQSKQERIAEEIDHILDEESGGEGIA